MDLFEKLIISKDELKQRKRLSQTLCGVNVTRLTMSTIFLYMIPMGISNYIVNIMNLYVFGILAGLTGAFWGYVITKAANDNEGILNKEKWYSYNDYYSLMFTLSKKARNYIVIIIVEFVVIYFLRLY